jgi:hypothetical protein
MESLTPSSTNHSKITSVHKLIDRSNLPDEVKQSIKDNSGDDYNVAINRLEYLS